MVPYGSIYYQVQTQAKIISRVRSQDTGYSWGKELLTERGHQRRAGNVLFLDLVAGS